MSLTIEQIEQQIQNLQDALTQLKAQKLEVSRSFTGQYFHPYNGKQYRRMESDGVSIWEIFDGRDQWILLTKNQSDDLERLFLEISTKSDEEQPPASRGRANKKVSDT